MCLNIILWWFVNGMRNHHASLNMWEKMLRNKIYRGHALRIAVGITMLSVLLLVSGASALSNSDGGSWAYYRDLTINNPGGDLTDYQVLVNLTGSNFPTNANSSGADIRFTDASGNEMSYWIESWDYAGRNGKVWVNVTSIPTSGNVTIRMHYGNPNATSASNGDTTFELFDDFSGTQVNAEKWNVTGLPYIDSGWLHVSVGDSLFSRNSIAGPYILEIRYKKIIMPEGYFGKAIGDGYGIYYDIDTGNHLESYSFYDNLSGKNYWREDEYVDGTWYYEDDGSTIPEQVQTIYNLKIYSDGVVFRTYRNDSLIKSRVLTHYFATKGKIAFGLSESGESAFDDVRIRKYASSEPSVNVGAEIGASDWPTYRHDFKRTGYTSEVIALPLEQKWNFTTGGESGPNWEPAVVNGTVYWGKDGKLYALNLNTGVMLWNKTLAGNDTEIGSPTVVDEIIYVVTGGIPSYKVYAIYSNGTIKWEYNLSSQTYLYNPLVYNNTVYIGYGYYWSGPYGIVALHADTGSYLWSYSDGYVIFDPAYYNGAIFAGSHGGILYSFNPATGAINWQYNTGGAWVWNSPSISNGVVYTTSSGTDNLLAIDASNGNVLWTIIPNTGRFLRAPFTITSDTAYLVTGVPYQDQRNELFAIDTVTRTVKWNFGEKLWLTLPVVAGNKVITGSADNNLYFLDATNGTVLWQYNFSARVYSVIVSKDVVLAVAGNALYAFSEANATPVLTSIIVSPSTASVASGSTQTFTASPKDQYGNPITAIVAWNSANVSVGTINETTGMFTALAAGTTTITASNGSVNGTATVIVTSDLVGEWRFDGNANDSSGNGNNGTINGATFVHGISGQALSFDGVDDYVNISNSATLMITDSITIEAWVNPRELGVWDRVVFKCASDDLLTCAYVFGLSSHGGVYFGMFNGHSQTYIDGSKQIPTDEWTHMTGTWDGTTMRIYINGVEQAETLPFVGPINSANSQLKLGLGFYSGDSYAFNGTIDEVRIYNRALSADEIKRQYDEIAPGCSGDLNGDGKINFDDFSLFAFAYGTKLGDPNFDLKADLNHDGKINFDDFAMFASVYGTSCSA
jgi:outer membrane protein assembly factor BamB